MKLLRVNYCSLSKSYNVARVLIDCFQWENVNEWVSLTVDGRSFDVFVKEFGSEMYSVQTHPNLEGSTTSFVSLVVRETSAEIGRSQAWKSNKGLLLGCVDDPQLEAIIDGRWDNVLCSSSIGGHGNLVDGDALVWPRPLTLQPWLGPIEGNSLKIDELDPMSLEAQLKRADLYLYGLKDLLAGPEGRLAGPEGIYDSRANSSIPFPPEFGPGLNNGQCDGNWNALRPVDQCVVDDSIVAGSVNAKNVLQKAGVPSESEKSDETRYLINEERRGCLLDVGRECNDDSTRVGGKCGDGRSNVDGSKGGGVLVPFLCAASLDGAGAFTHCDNTVNSVNLSEENLYLINSNFVNESRKADDGALRDVIEGDAGEEWESVEEEDNSAEVLATKEIWCRGGLFFDSSDEEEIHSKLVRQKKIEGKRRTDLRPKEQKQGKKPPYIQGRSFATKKLMSEEGWLLSGGSSGADVGGIWGGIMAAGRKNKEMLELYQSGRELVVGNGGRIGFWHENR
ncbi:hypothetical protein PIB30_021863 [Stylosanthes scabra]|uniref:Uncharacterized protein n=1 Tax=Stylosanthes scabra TaxID=79078 RepID=A0ABU6Q9F6_9FABA|nr:hypothetical protein [Stylosanthes scabra]